MCRSKNTPPKLNLVLDPNPAPSYYNASSGMEGQVYPNYTEPYGNQHIPATATSGEYSRDQQINDEQVQHFCSFLFNSRILFILFHDDIQ